MYIFCNIFVCLQRIKNVLFICTYMINYDGRIEIALYYYDININIK